MLERLLCALFGHRYVVLKAFAPHTRKVGCTRCTRAWGMHDPTRSFVPYDGEMEEMHRRLYPEAFAPQVPTHG